MAALPGPTFGVNGLRQLFGVPNRPLLAIEVGPRSEELTNDLLSAYQTALVAGVDILVDDMLMGNPPGPWHQSMRVPALTRVCESASQQTGKRKAYFTALAGTPRTIQSTAHWAQQNQVGGFVLNAFTQGFGVLEDLAQGGIGCAIITTNMGSGTASRPPTERANLTLSQRVGIDEQVFAKLSRLAGADAVHCGTTGSECVDIPWGNAIRALSQPLRLAQRSIPSSFRVAEGDLQHKDAWPNIRELGTDTLFEVATAIMADRQQVRRRTERFVSLLENLTNVTTDGEAYRVYREAAHHDTYMQDQLNLIDRDNW